MIPLTNNKYIWTDVYKDTLYLKIRQVLKKFDLAVHTQDGINMNVREARKFFEIFDNDWKDGDVFRLSPYKMVYYTSGHGEVLSISCISTSDGTYTVGKGILLKGVEISHLRASIGDAKDQFFNASGSDDAFHRTMKDNFEKMLNSGAGAKNEVGRKKRKMDTAAGADVGQ